MITGGFLDEWVGCLSELICSEKLGRLLIFVGSGRKEKSQGTMQATGPGILIVVTVRIFVVLKVHILLIASA